MSKWENEKILMLFFVGETAKCEKGAALRKAPPQLWDILSQTFMPFRRLKICGVIDYSTSVEMLAGLCYNKIMILYKIGGRTVASTV